MGQDENPGVMDLWQVDKETGEVHDGVLVLVPRRVRGLGGFVMLFQEALEAAAVDKEFGLNTHRVLNLLMARLDFENFIHVPQAEVARILGIDRANVNREMTLLTQKGLLVRGPKVGRSLTYRLNHKVAWKGRLTNLQKEVKNGLRVINGGLTPDERRKGFARAAADVEALTPPTDGPAS